MLGGFARRSVISLVALVSVCFLVLAHDSASSLTFKNGTNLSNSPGFDSEGARAVHLGGDLPGIFTAWLENSYEDDPMGGVRLCHSEAPMSPPINCTVVPEEPGNTAFLSVGGAGDRLYASWLHYTDDAFSGEVRFTHSMDGGATWSDPTTVATGAYQPRFVADGERVFMGYLDWNTGDAMVREGLPVGNGISWGIPETTSTGLRRMDLFMGDDGRLFVLAANNGQLQVNIVEAGEPLPGTSEFIGNSGASAFDLDYLYEEGALVPLFLYTDPLSHSLYVVCLGVDDWGEPVLVAVNSLGIANPVIAASGGDAYAAWQADAGDRFVVRGRSIQCDEDGTAVPGEPLLLSDDERNSFGPQVSINGPRLYVAWNDSPVDNDEDVDIRLKAGRLDDYPTGGSEYIDPTFDYPFKSDFMAFMLVLAHANVNDRTPGTAAQGGDQEGAPFLHFFYYQVDSEGQSDIFWQLGLITGDTDCSATITAVDALQVLRETAGLPTTGECLPAGDVNCDEGRDAVDALLIQRHVAALPVSQPDGCSPIDF